MIARILHGKGSSLPSFLQILEQVSPNPEEIHCSGALSYPERNRSEKFLPGKYSHCELGQCAIIIAILLFPADRWRVNLKGEQPDYIHAVSINVSDILVSMNFKSIIY